MTINQAIELALQHHQSGRLPEAEAIYRQILEVEPRHANALHYLGILAHQMGKHDISVDLIRQAIALTPCVADFHSNLGVALKASGRLEEAIAAYRQAIALKPAYPAAHNNLGVALVESGQFDEATDACRKAIDLKQDDPEAHSNLGNALHGRGMLDEAIDSYRRAIALRPDFPDAYSNLGSVLREKELFDEAIVACRKAIDLKHDYPEAHNNLGNALHGRGLLDEAIAAHRRAITLNPSFAEAHCNLGAALRDRGDLDEAIVAYRQSIALKPGFAEAYGNLGIALQEQGQLDEAIAAYRHAHVLKPDDAEAYNSLGTALKDRGQLEEAIGCFRRAIALKPDFPSAHSNLLFTLNYHPGFDAQAIAEEHRRWNQQYAAPLRPSIPAHANERTPNRRLRIGYVSPDFRAHPVGRFLLPLLANHDHQCFEVFAYAQVPVPDAMTERLRTHVDRWRSLFGLSDSQAEALIREDRIDILVDLAGHTANHRLLVFALQPAPVQATWLGYPNTTGLDTIDYRLTDALADPPSQDDLLYTEELTRLFPSAWCFVPDHSPPVALRQNGPVTFGSFNACAKINDTTLELWGRILRAVPDSRLLLKSSGTGSPCVRQRIERILGDSCIAADRLELRGYSADHAGHLALYERMDIALDTYPYHGTTTTCEALWMGVPVVSLAGSHHVSRVGASLLTNAGLPELVAETPDDYVRIAVSLANDLPRLAHLRATLRERMERSPLMDAPRFARDIEAAYREMWRQWCKKAG